MKKVAGSACNFSHFPQMLFLETNIIPQCAAKVLYEQF